MVGLWEGWRVCAQMLIEFHSQLCRHLLILGPDIAAAEYRFLSGGLLRRLRHLPQVAVQTGRPVRLPLIRVNQEANRLLVLWKTLNQAFDQLVLLVSSKVLKRRTDTVGKPCNELLVLLDILRFSC